MEKAEVQIANTSKYALQSASAPKENSEVEKTASVLAATTRLLAASISDSSKSLESEPQTPLSSGEFVELHQCLVFCSHRARAVKLDQLVFAVHWR